MFKFVIFFSALGCALSAVRPLDKAQVSDVRIVGGNETKIEKYPWQVSLQDGDHHICGGSIYSETIIVTAAHCLPIYFHEHLSVRYGSSLSGIGGTVIPVAAWKIHEEFNDELYMNDIAVIKLSSPIQFSEKARPIKLATVRPADGAPARASGWGHTYHGGDVVERLREVALDILNIPACSSDKFLYGTRIMESMICAYAPGKDTCQSDSGGPLVVDDALVGLVSWGEGCARIEYPGVYADVVTLHSWLINTIESI